jgi:hypothetical protein
MILPDDIETALSSFAKAQGLQREDAIKRILQEWLTNEGYLSSGDEGIPPYKLNASNDD